MYTSAELAEITGMPPCPSIGDYCKPKFKLVRCIDGFTMSVQAGAAKYSLPRSTSECYTLGITKYGEIKQQISQSTKIPWERIMFWWNILSQK